MWKKTKDKGYQLLHCVGCDTVKDYKQIILIGVMIVLSLSGCGRKKYTLNYDGYGFESKRMKYEAGETVVVRFDNFATDTDYHFYIDDDVDMNTSFDGGYVFTFTMPAHDVTLHKESHNSMEYIPDSVPVEYETADGFMRSFLLASDRDLIGTTNDYGDFYRIVYSATLEDDELTACGSMDYRKFKDQDSITVSSDLTHIFKLDDNTVYRMGTESGDVTISKEDFAELLDSRKNPGRLFEVEINGGVVKTVYLAAQ